MLVINLEINSFDTGLVAEIEKEPLNNPLKRFVICLFVCLFVVLFATMLTPKYAAEFRRAINT